MSIPGCLGNTARWGLSAVGMVTFPELGKLIFLDQTPRIPVATSMARCFIHVWVAIAQLELKWLVSFLQIQPD